MNARIIAAAGAIALGASLAACHSTPTYSGPALTPGSATAAQICQAGVGSALQNTLTGQNNGESIVSYSDAAITSNLNASGNEVATCTYTLDTGALWYGTDTLFANGSIGFTENIAAAIKAAG